MHDPIERHYMLLLDGRRVIATGPLEAMRCLLWVPYTILRVGQIPLDRRIDRPIPRPRGD